MAGRDDPVGREPPSAVPPVEGSEAEKAELQRRMEEARESISQTVGEIKDTVEGQYATVKDAVTGILDWREQFREDPIVWSVGALSAGFALGYTLGLAEKHGALGRKQGGVSGFADTLLKGLAAVRQHLPLAALDPTMKQLLGVELSELFDEMEGTRHRRARSAPKRPRTRPTKKATARKRSKR